ncbi:hypothetical protein [Alteromonas macleodii]|uniref:hypothetical protein n=1 Tax=Alteromonas macleodii TaxID=28108 RepID=UPI00313E735E
MLFIQNATGANANVDHYSNIETTKVNELNVIEYAMICFDEFIKPDVDIERLIPTQFAKR